MDRLAAPIMRLAILATGLHAVAGRKPWCPVPWAESQCLGTSGALAAGPQIPYDPTDEPVKWQEGMAGHSHYSLNASGTALLVIDPQSTYAACPKTGPPYQVADLIAGPETANFDGHSPLCCESFSTAIANANRLAGRARELAIPVFAVAHVYRDLDADGQVDNCGRICDFDVLGWTGWPMAWNLWNEAFPWHRMVYKGESTPHGFDVDFSRDFYTEKSTYSALTEPVVAKLRAQGINTIIVTGFMTQYCSVTTTRHGSDLGFRMIFVQDACDGPILAELLSGVNENTIVPFHLGIAVADVTNTEDLLAQMATSGAKDEL